MLPHKSDVLDMIVKDTQGALTRGTAAKLYEREITELHSLRLTAQTNIEKLLQKLLDWISESPRTMQIGVWLANALGRTRYWEAVLPVSPGYRFCLPQAAKCVHIYSKLEDLKHALGRERYENLIQRKESRPQFPWPTLLVLDALTDEHTATTLPGKLERLHSNYREQQCLSCEILAREAVEK